MVHRRIVDHLDLRNRRLSRSEGIFFESNVVDEEGSQPIVRESPQSFRDPPGVMYHQWYIVNWVASVGDGKSAHGWLVGIEVR